MAELQVDSILPDIEDLIDAGQSGALLNIMMDMHPSDIEGVLNRLKKDRRKFLFELLPAELASEVLSELDAPVAEDVLEEADDERISSIIHEMDSDDAADIVAELPEDVQERVLNTLEDEVSDDVKELLVFDEDTAGGIMALEVLSMPDSSSVNETIEKIREVSEDVDHLYNIWVVDKINNFLGSVSLKDLVLAGARTKLFTIMDTEIKTIHVSMDQEEVANFFKKYDLISAPVVDDAGKLVGRITIDDIVDVLEEEGSEDMARISGAPDEEIQEDSAFIISRARIPWLLVAFVGELIAAFILQQFNLEPSQQLIIAAFIPIVMAMGGASGQQASVTVVRGLAMGDIELHDTGSRLFKEFRVSLLNSTFFSILLFLIVYWWSGMIFAIILAGSMFIVINNATVLGALVPLFFKRINIDPALAAAPLVSTSNDIIGILIYLSITTYVLSVGL
ncbi:MAG: magnesium transporter [Calditrichaeota bacterium]|nr:MAG: magnesium transporter [Calditrichota bacterium]MBL1206033.1 magnesium transporter [Calditrichota bacterium]NOG45861.1 magnesium transporter [Calditrichota bacterium]